MDAIGVWGRRGVARRGLAAARLSGKPVVTIEDGFLRSVNPGSGAPVISLILDDVGIYYDASAPSRLEMLLNEGVEARGVDEGIALLRESRLSKYNNAPSSAKPQGHVLVIDQTAGDASIKWGGASGESFRRMLEAAKSENPGADIIIKTHPEVTGGRKNGHFSAADADGWVQLETSLCNPWDLIEGASRVYTVSSQMGMEALIAGKLVRTFGKSFYAGWGATEDELGPISRRETTRTAAEIFAAAYFAYPTYFDPWTGELSTFTAAANALAHLRDAWLENAEPTTCAGVRLWKRRDVARFLDGPSGPPKFTDQPQAGRRHIAWATKVEHADSVQMEDGFLRSIGLGAALTPPLSLVLDDEGVYFDPGQPSRLDRILNAAPFDDAKRARAQKLRERIVTLGLSKYNLRGDAVVAIPEGARVILAPGQVEDDASILKGAGEVRTNADLIRAIRKAAPDAFILYKPHPDVEAGLRPGADAGDEADAVIRGVGAAEAMALADEVWTITSLMGFEALLRGLPVTCFGTPFYAGWGLTADRGATPKWRSARPCLVDLVHAALIDYPRYIDPVTKLPCPVEVAVERLAEGEANGGVGLKLLSKAQGAFASYAWLWR
ncbi:MAG: capsular polysaccharide biosynthesis protein [Pseudomonadota bacterium]